MIYLTCRITAVHPSQVHDDGTWFHSTGDAFSLESFAISHKMLAGGDVTSPPLCIFGTGDGRVVTVDSQVDLREISAKMSIGRAGISDNPDTPINLRYTFDATYPKERLQAGLEPDPKDNIATDPEGNLETGLKTKPKDNLATGSALTYSNVDMHIFSDTYDPNPTAPNIHGHFQDKQEQRVRGLFDLSTTFEYTT